MTVVPRFTVIVLGEKEMFTITMVFGGLVPAGTLFPYGLDVSLLHPHKARIMISITIIPIFDIIVFITFLLSDIVYEYQWNRVVLWNVCCNYHTTIMR